MKLLKTFLLLAVFALIVGGSNASAQNPIAISAVDGYGHPVPANSNVINVPSNGTSTASIYADVTSPHILSWLDNSFAAPPNCTVNIQYPTFPHSGVIEIHCVNPWVNTQGSPFPVKASAKLPVPQTGTAGITVMYYISVN